MYTLCRDLQRRSHALYYERISIISLSPALRRLLFYALIVIGLYFIVSADYASVKKGRERIRLKSTKIVRSLDATTKEEELKKGRGRENERIIVNPSLVKISRSNLNHDNEKRWRKKKSLRKKKRKNLREKKTKEMIQTISIERTTTGIEENTKGVELTSVREEKGGLKITTKGISNSTKVARKKVSPAKRVKSHDEMERMNTFASDLSMIADGESMKSEEKGIEREEETCKIPKLDLHSDEIDHLFFNEKLECKGGENWATIEEGTVRLKRKGATCYGQEVIRINDDKNKRGTRFELVDGDRLKSESTFVSCVHDGNKWEGILWSAIRKEKRLKDLQKLDKGSGISIVIMSFDSMSHLTFRRKLPKTVEALEKMMGSVILNGYNIVGDGTPQAFLPILTGKTERELPNTRKWSQGAKFVSEVYPFIWNNFSSSGYTTAFIEDSSNAGMFNYRLKGFDKPPVDHYGRTHFIEWEKQADAWYVPCFGGEPQYKQWFRYTKELLQSYNGLPKFILTHHGTYSHQNINTIGNIDDDFVQWIESSVRQELFNNTVLIVMADHGHRFSQLRDTHQGQLEERLPFFSISLPKTLRDTEIGEKMLFNLNRNVNRLVTPFDIYQSLFDLLNLKTAIELTKDQDVTTRSLSIFQPIPSSRSCNNAGIPVHWCTCLAWKEVSTLPISKGIVENVVQAINNLTEIERNLCAPLTLHRIYYVKKLFTPQEVLKYSEAKDAHGHGAKLNGKAEEAFSFYQIKFSTKPGRAIYEATVKHVNSRNSTTVDFRAISHISKYGDDSHCIRDTNTSLLEYCVCSDRLGEKSK